MTFPFPLKLAGMHAASYHFLQTFPGGLEAFKRDYVHFIMDTWLPAENEEQKKRSEREMTFGYEVLTRLIDAHHPNRELAAKMVAFQPKHMTHLLAVTKTDPEEFNCLLHNDAWCHNFMFK